MTLSPRQESSQCRAPQRFWSDVEREPGPVDFGRGETHAGIGDAVTYGKRRRDELTLDGELHELRFFAAGENLTDGFDESCEHLLFFVPVVCSGGLVWSFPADTQSFSEGGRRLQTYSFSTLLITEAAVDHPAVPDPGTGHGAQHRRVADPLRSLAPD